MSTDRSSTNDPEPVDENEEQPGNTVTNDEEPEEPAEIDRESR